jgi:pimeloyl-ACP methyl ester carboxylesterase
MNDMRSKTQLSRRDFAAITAGSLSMAALLAADETAQTANTPLDIVEWSYFWVGVERAELARGTVVNGKQMYVEYQIPAQVRHPFPIVLVHGGGGQGLDWMGTPDGRPGWATYLLQEGYMVYVVDRPGHGRSPFHPETHGAFPQQANTLENISGRFTPPNASTRNANEFQKEYHNQWPGTGEVGSKDLDQFVASQGGSYVTGAGQDVAHAVWRERGAMLLDKIGPAIIMTHSAGGPFGWLVAEARPSLVKGIIAIEGGGQPFAGANVWGMSTIPVVYDPPVSDPSEIKTVTVNSPEPGVAPYKLQAEPARKLKNLVGIPIVVVTSEGSFASPGNPGAVAFFKQAGCNAEELRLVTRGVHGNGHMMVVEKNSREVLNPILEWIDKNVSTKNPPTLRPSAGKRSGDSTAMKLADQGYFWVGTEHKKMPYGTILTGQMYVQYLIPAQVRYPYPVVLVHGGGGSMLHYMGLGDGQSGWAHYYVQQGYRVYLVDRPGHGRAPYHPDALGPMSPIPTYQSINGDLMRAAKGAHRQWPGTGDVGDPALDQIQAGQNAAPLDNVFAHKLWASRGAELLDKIGPAIIQVHSAGGPFGFLVANERPNLVKAIVSVEGGGAPFTPQTPWGLTDVPLVFDPPVSEPSQLATREVTPASGPAYKLQAEPARKLKNLQGIPIVYVTAEKSGRTGGPAVAAFLKQAGCDAGDLQLKDRGVLGNGHFMMLETNRKQVFDVIHGWLDMKIPGKA